MFKDSGNYNAPFRNLSATEIKEILDHKNGTRIIDVREEWEHKLAKIENSELMPLSSFMSHVSELDRDEELIFYCHTGVRSANVCNYLAAQGFKNLINLNGGIEAWTNEVDPSVPRY